MESKTHAVKITVVGDGGVGKTSLILTYSRDHYPCDYFPGMFENESKRTTFANQTVDVSIWDTGGQDEYDRLRPLAYPDTDVFLICFCVTTPTSFERVRTKWLPEVAHHCPNVPTLLVGTRTDLRSNGGDGDDNGRTAQLHIRAEQGQQLAEEIGASMYLECAAKTQDGVTNLFDKAIRVALSAAQKNGKKSCYLS